MINLLSRNSFYNVRHFVICIILLALLLFAISASSKSNDNEPQQVLPVSSAQRASQSDMINNFLHLLMPAASFSVSMQDSFSPGYDVDNDGNADAGDKIRYTVTITNNSGSDAANLHFSAALDMNTTLVSNSVHAQPIAVADSYTTVGNTMLECGVAAAGSPAVRVTGSLFDNDTIATDSIQLESYQSSSINGGAVSVKTDGTFTYLPPIGFTGTDTFNYTVRNSSDNSLIDSAVVTVTIAGRVWYVDNSYTGTNGSSDGRSTRPFTSLTPVNGSGGSGDSDSIGDIVYLFTGSSNYSTGIQLESGQQLVGNGAALVVNASTLRLAGPPPTITNGSGNAVTLSNDNTITGLNLTASANAAVGASGVGGTTSIVGVGISTSGTGAGLSVTNQSGTLNITGSPISGVSSGTAVSINGGAANVNFSNSAVSRATGRIIDIQNKTGGAVTFNDGSTISSSGNITTDAILLLNNTNGTTVTFSNNVTVATNSSGADCVVADNSTGSFTLNMNASGNTFSATGGAALDLQDVAANIASSATSSTSSTTNGLRINNTSGSFILGNTTAVLGAAATGVLLTSNSSALTFSVLNITSASGQRALHATNNIGAITTTSGTISSTNNTAVEIAGASAANRTPLNMQLTAVNTNGGGVAPNGITLTNSSSAGNPGGFRVLGAGGACTFANPACSGGRIQNTVGAEDATPENNAGIGVRLFNAQQVFLTRMRIDNHNNFAIQGTNVVGFNLDSSVVDGVNGSNSTFEEGAISFSELTGMAIQGTSSSINNSFIGGGHEFLVAVNNFSTGTLDRLTIHNNTIGDLDGPGSGFGLHPTSGDDALLFNSTAPNSTLKVSVTNNIINVGRGDAVNFNVGNGGTHTADFVLRNNTMHNAHPQILSGGGGVTVTAGGPTNHAVTYDISCNSIRGSRGFGLLVAKAGTGSSGIMQGTIFNNRIGVEGTPGSGSSEASGINVDTRGGGTHIVLIKNNQVHEWGANGAYQIFNNQGSAVMNATLQGNLSNNPHPTNALAGLYAEVGALSGDTSVLNILIGGAGVAENNFVEGDPFNGSDVLLSRIAGSGTVMNLSRGTSVSGSPAQIVTDNNTDPVTTGTAGAITVVSSSPTLPPIIDESCTPVAILNDKKGFNPRSYFAVLDTYFNNNIDNASFSFSGIVPGFDSIDDLSRPFTRQGSVPMVGSVAHASMYENELPIQSDGPLQSSLAGIKSGVEKNSSVLAHGDSKQTLLKRLNILAEKIIGVVSPSAHAASSPIMAAQPLTVGVSLNTLPAGKTVKIVFDVTVNTPPVTKYTTQGTVTANGPISVQTDDPDINGVNTNPPDPTVTKGDRYNTSTVLTSAPLSPVNVGENVAFTAVVTPSEGSGFTPNGTVQFKDGGSNLGSAVNCIDNGGTTCKAELQTNALSVGNHLITAEYLGGTNHDSSTSNTLSYSVIACATNPVVTNVNDSLVGSLRQAITDACPGSTVTFNITGSGPHNIILTSGELVISKNLIIIGPSDKSIIISANDTSRIFNISSGNTVSISNLVIKDGKFAGDGGAIYNEGVLTLDKINVSGSNADAGSGGGIFNASTGNLAIADSTVEGNEATGGHGGGLYNLGVMNISTSTISSNYAKFMNGSGGAGGGIDGNSGTLNVFNSTISGNTADGGGGGIHQCGDSEAKLVNVTITNNRSNYDGLPSPLEGGGIEQISSKAVTLDNTIVAGNFRDVGSIPDDLAGGSGLTSFQLQNSLIQTPGAAGINDLGGNLLNQNPQLGPLANNGGTTSTHLLLPGSPAINTGKDSLAKDQNNIALETDQRGGIHSRIVSTQVDMGAVEVSYAITAVSGTTPQTTVINTTFATQLQATVTESGNPVNGMTVNFKAPASGATGTFLSTGMNTATATTNASGVATASVFTANGTAGGPYNVAASLDDDTPAANFAMTNTKAQAQVNLSNLVQTYDGTPKTVAVSTVPAGLNVVVTYNGSTNPPTDVKAGGYAVLATINDVNFDGTANATLTIDKASSTTTVIVSNAVFNGNSHGGTAVATSVSGLNQNLTVSYKGRNTTTYGPSATPPTNAGDYIASATFPGDNNHLGSNDSIDFQIGRASQVITFSGPGNKSFGDAPFNLSATASSGLAVGLSSQTPDVCPLSGSTVSIVAAGTCTIRASQAGNSNFEAADSVDQSFTVARANQTITFNVLSNQTFGDAPFNISATASSGLPVSFATSGACTITGDTVYITGAGSCTVIASQAGDSNYNPAMSVPQSFNIAKANQTLTFNALSNMTFGDANFTVSATASSGEAVSFTSQTTSVCTVSGSTVAIVAAGTCTIRASQGGNTNFNGATDVQQSFQIAKAASTTAVISSVNPSAIGQSVTFTATVSNSAGTPVGTVQFKDGGANLGPEVALSGSGVATLTTDALTAGTHTITAEYGGDGNFNASTGTLSGGQVVSITSGLSIDDVTVTEGNSGTTNAVFTVTLSQASNVAVTVDYATADGTSPNAATTADNDYQSATGTLTFNIGETSKTVTALVNGDTKNEPNERFFVNLSNAQNANISDNQGQCTISNDDSPGVQLSQSTYTINEGLNNTPQGFTSLVVDVTRTGDLSQPATVRYITSDASGGAECNQVTGQASQRCDYILVGATLRFAAGEDKKTIQIPIVNDGYLEGAEFFQIELSNASGATLGSPSIATITIQDDAADSTPTTSANNPYLNNSFFVRQNYLDLLGRDADQNGFTDWTGVLNNCGPQQGFLGAPKTCDRAHVSHGFFGSVEFTNSGFLIHRLFEVGMGRLPLYREFIPDMATLSGFNLSQAQQQQNLLEYLQEFTSKQEFTNRFQDVSQPNQAALFIERLEQAAGVTLPATATTSPGQPTQYGRQELINLRAAGTLSLGQTLKAFVEQKVVYDHFFERGEVTMLYFAYLRRDPNLNNPNLTGWTDWVDVFTNGRPAQGIQPRDIHHLIFGFIYSDEYRKRFGQP